MAQSVRSTGHRRTENPIAPQSSTPEVQRSLAAPAGFDSDGSHHGLIWLGSNELQGVEFELAEWLQAQLSRLTPPHEF